MSRTKRIADFLGLTRPADAPKQAWWVLVGYGILGAASGMVAIWLLEKL